MAFFGKMFGEGWSSCSQPIKTAKDFKCPTFRVSSSLRRLRISKLTIKIIFDSKASSSVRPSRNGSNITEVTAKLKREYKVIKLLPIKIKIVIIIYYLLLLAAAVVVVVVAVFTINTETFIAFLYVEEA